MKNIKVLLEFVEPYYSDKDIMHNMWHIELVKRKMESIVSIGKYQVDSECLLLATYFHGFIYKAENENGVSWLPSDFKKKGGYQRSIELSREYDLYRQDYCGCVYSKEERERQRS